ncbi:MAG: hypothetical protein U9O98_07350, partial [Asgard group archaeon]|nr:hypothetical protein [Asgard group archaeon]
KLTLDRDVYRIGDDDVTYTLELTNIGNAPATDIDYQLYHGFINDNFDLGYVKRIPNTKGSIEIINPGETETVQLTGSVYTHVGLHPVFAEFGYNSSETLDLDHPLIFSQCRHQAVYSNLDFGFVLPPLNDEGSTKPIYPTPEVEVETELLGLTNETTIGDTLTFRTTITNVGTEETNIIYIQRLPRALEPPSSEEEVNITIDGIPVTDYSVIWDPNPAFGMPLALIGEDFNQQGAFGIPLGVDETMVIEIDVTVRSAGDIYIPPTEIRYRSQYNMSDTNAPQQPAKDEARSIPAGLQTQSNDGIIDPIFSIEDTNPDIAEDRTTNDWGSYSDSLSIVIEELTQFGGKKLLYIGIGIVGITGVAVLIYFTTNGKK